MTKELMSVATGQCLTALTERGFIINDVIQAITGSRYIKASRKFAEDADVELTIRISDHETMRRFDYYYDIFSYNPAERLKTYLERII